MKKTAVLIYDKFCYFEISVALEVLALKEKGVTIFAKDMSPVKSEDGLTVMPDKSIFEIDLNEYDSLLLPGAMDIREAIESEEILSFIKMFDEQKKIIGAISIAPILLVKNGVMKDRSFMAGVNAEDLYEEGFTHEQLKNLHGWNDNLKEPIQEGYIISDHIITSVSYNFVHFGLAFTKMLGIDFAPKWFGIKEER